MFKSKFYWYVMMLGAIGGWVFSIYGIVKPFKDENLKKVWKNILATWVIGHPLELAISTRIGKNLGLSSARTVIKTLLFGFTWWLPLKLGIIKK